MPCGECDHFYDDFCGIQCEQYIGKCCDLSYCNNGAEPLHACCTFFDDNVCYPPVTSAAVVEKKPVAPKAPKKPVVKPVEVDETEEICETEDFAGEGGENFDEKFNDTGFDFAE